MGVDVFLDRGDEVGHGVEDAAPQRFVGQFPEPAFDQVEPRRRCRGEVEVEPRVFVQPVRNVFVLVGGVVVAGLGGSQVRGHLRVDGLEEFQPFLMPVPGMHWLMIMPVSTFSAANKVVVPWRL